MVRVGELEVELVYCGVVTTFLAKKRKKKGALKKKKMKTLCMDGESKRYIYIIYISSIRNVSLSLFIHDTKLEMA